MKKILLLLTLLISSITFSQAPEGINYQAVIRNSIGNLVTSTTVAIRVQVRQTTATGTVVYQERHSVLSSAQGLVNMVIGGGTPQVGTFNGINWGMGPFFVNLAVDFANGINYQDFGTQQLMSVPYALYAKTSGNQLNQWRYGNTVPPSALGNFGDFYLDVITGNVYYKNNNTAWILTGNIKGPVGPTGAAGTNGLNGINGQNTLVKTTTESAGSNCTTGGIKIEYGLDANSNGILDAGEINATLSKYVCNGASGATGAQGPQGVAGAVGTNGVNGKNTLAKTTTEVAGANCTTGGIKIEYGLDANNNGILDLSEINAALTKYVCNGATGLTGPQGPIGLTGPQGTPGSLNAWSLTGNAGTNPTTNFIGTTDAQDWAVKTNNFERMRLTSGGLLGIGTTLPLAQLTISEKNLPNIPTFAISDDLNFKRFSINIEGDSDTSFSNVRFDVFPKTNSDQAQFRFFNQTNTSGSKTVRFYKGDGNAVSSAVIGVDGENSFFQLHGGNFGIGTSSPGGTFHSLNSNGYIKHSTLGGTYISRTSGTPLFIYNEDNNNTTNNLGQIQLLRGDGTGTDCFITTTGDGSNGVSAMGFWIGSMKMRILANGNVGIGTNTPARTLHVSDVMRLEPRATAPTSPAKGDMYFDSTLNKLRVYDGTAWQNCW